MSENITSLLGNNKKYIADPDIIYRATSNKGAILYNTRNEKLRSLNTTGLQVWRCLQIPVSIHDLVQQLLEIYDGIEKTSLEKDISGILQPLMADGFIGELLEIE